MESSAVSSATFTPLPAIPANPSNGRAVVLNWRKCTSSVASKCEVCDGRNASSSVQCRRCKARICIECTKPEGKSTQRCKDMAADFQLQGRWCGADGKFNMEFAAPTTMSQSLKRKRASMNALDFLWHPATSRPSVGINGRYSTSAMRKFIPLNQTCPSIGETMPAHKKRKLTKAYAIPIDDLDETTTVIIGSGMIGLLTAFELVTKTEDTETDLRIVVLDLNEDACHLASQHGAGQLSLEGMDERWTPLDHGIVQRWQNIEALRDPNIKLSATQTPRIDIGETSPWIKRRCEDLGVEFCFQTRVFGATQDRAGRISSIEIGLDGAVRPTDSIPCSNLIITAGPFTTGIYARLFPNSQLKLENNVQQVQKLHLNAVRMRADGVHSVDHDGRLKFVAKADDHTADVFMIHEIVENKLLGIDDALKHHEGSAGSLLQLASTHLISSEQDSKIHRSNISEKSRSTISTGNGGCPVIGKVPVSSKTPGDSEGVFLAYGFGTFGTTLAPVVAEMVTQLVYSEASTADLRAFKILTTWNRAKPKGKGGSLASTTVSGTKGKHKTQPGGKAKKANLKKTFAKKTFAKKTAPKKTAPKKTAPKKTAPKKAASKKTDPKKTNAKIKPALQSIPSNR